MSVIARRLGCTEGQAATLVIGLALAILLAVVGIPPTLEDRPQIRAAAPRGLVAAAPLEAPPPPGFEPSTEEAIPFQREFAPVPESGVGSATSLGAFISSPDPDTQATRAPSARVSRFARVGPPGAPEGIVVTESGDVFVTTNNGETRGRPGPSVIFHFTAGGGLARKFEVSGQPVQKRGGLTGLALDAAGALIALDASTGRVLRFAVTNGAQSTVATLFNLPACGAVAAAPACEPGSADHPPFPKGVALDAAGNIYVTDAGQATIWRLAAGAAQAEPWHSSSEYLGPRALGGITVDQSGRLAFAAGDLFRLTVGVAGRPGTRSLLADLDDGAGAAGMVLGPGGEVVVALSNLNQLVVIREDGVEQARLSSDAPEAVRFDAPTGVTRRGATLLVTNQSSAANIDEHWAVLQFTAPSDGSVEE